MDNLRENMPALSNKTYFNYGGQGPLPDKSLEAIIDSWRKIQRLGPFTSSVWPYIGKEIAKTREVLGDLCGVNPQRIALTENVTSGCVLPLWGLPFCNGDRILISDCEHPGVIAACYEIAKRFKMNIDILKLQDINSNLISSEINNLILDSFQKKLKVKTRLVVISHLLWNTGQIIPIKVISEILNKHPNQPYLLVDGAQSFSHLSIKETASIADIYAFTGHKWACGPEGLGGVALSERVLSESSPTLIGWRSLKDEDCEFQNNSDLFHKDGRRFEIATSCIPLMAGLRSSLEILEKLGEIEVRLKKIKQTSSMLWRNISAINNIQPALKDPPPSGIISFKIKSKYTNNEITKILGDKKIFIRSLSNPNCLRACVHITTTKEEINIISKSLRELNL